MSHTNESMPEWVPRIELDELRIRTLELEAKFWAEKYVQVVRKMENMVDSCKDYGYVELSWREKKFKFTMEELK